METHHRIGFGPSGVIFCAFFTFAAIACAGSYSGGAGTAEDPYKISTVADWQELIAASGDWDKHFILLNDIDFGGINLTPVAPDTQPLVYFYQGTPFVGVFNGNHHVLRNGILALASNDFVGLFGNLGSGGQIHNLGVENIPITGRDHVGGLCGYSYLGTIRSCYATGSVAGSDAVGGLCGTIAGGTLNFCYATGHVTGGNDSYSIGGLCGDNLSGTIQSCYATGNVVGGGSVGGLCGDSFSGASIRDSYASGSVTGGEKASYLGGLCGDNDGGYIVNCYSSGAVIGGIGSTNIGGLCGMNLIEDNKSGYISGCFWDVQTSGWVTSFGGRGLTTAQMKTLSLFQNAGWNGKAWSMEDQLDYPRLAWENTGYAALPEPGPVPLAGNGSEADPYQIQTAEDLASLSWHTSILDQHLRLMADLDVTGYDIYPIGDRGNPFTGVFDGNGHIIHNITIDLPSNQDVGLFGVLESPGQIRNLGMDNFAVSGRELVGGLCGNNYKGAIIDCYAAGSVTGINSTGGGLCGLNDQGTISGSRVMGIVSGQAGSSYLGGLCGVNYGAITVCHAESSVGDEVRYFTLGGLCAFNYGDIGNCSVTGTVSGGDSSARLGGLVGHNDGTITSCFASSWIVGGNKSFDLGGLCGGDYDGTVMGCYATGSITTGDNSYNIGGLQGFNLGTISRCYASSIISSTGDSVGGLVGQNYDTITSCYARGAVSGHERIGGLVGDNIDQGTISDCYATGRVTGVGGWYSVGGLCGINENDLPISNCFWDTQTSGQTTSDGGEGKTTAEMKTLATFAEAGWDFVYSDGNAPVWKMPAGGYPVLLWEYRYSGGTGTAEDPFKISTVADWQELIATSADWDKHFILLNDIDFGGINLTPVAPDTNPNSNGFQGKFFTGIFDGKGHVLRNIIMTLPGDDYIGIFGETSGATIENMGVTNVDIIGRSCVGGLVGFQLRGSIASCYVTGSVSGTTRVGGLAGSNSFGPITNCYANGLVNGTVSVVGGLAGENLSGSITGCHTSGTVNGPFEVGGLAGINDVESSVTSCYASGSVIGTGFAIGGLVGWNASVITASFATGSVTGTNEVGGLVGYTEGDATVTSCYATGSTHGKSKVGGLVGSHSGEIFNSYSVGAVSASDFAGGLVGYSWAGVGPVGAIDSFWDTQTSGQSQGVGKGSSAGVTGKTTAEMKTKATFTEWDFDNIWAICDGTNYPRLKWQIPATDWVCPDGVAMEDLLYLAGRWMASTPATVGAADGNADGRVDLLDLAILSENWGRE